MPPGDQAPPVRDLRTLVVLEAWANPRIRTELQENPRGTVAEIAKKHRVELPDVNLKVVFEEPGDYTLVIPENPVGKSPAEVRATRSSSPGVPEKTLNPVCTYTTPCGCADTYETHSCLCDPFTALAACPDLTVGPHCPAPS